MNRLVITCNDNHRPHIQPYAMEGGFVNFIQKNWQGGERLWKVFWIYNWALGALLGVGLEAVITSLKSLPRSSGIVAVGLTCALLYLVYVVWIWMSLWRCAFNTSWRGWGYMTRAFVLVAAIVIAAEVVTMFSGV